MIGLGGFRACCSRLFASSRLVTGLTFAHGCWHDVLFGYFRQLEVGLLFLLAANRGHLFVFMTNREVPYTNNVSERHLRPSVIFRKVTNGFRCDWGAETYAAFRSVVGTAKANSASVLDTIRFVLSSQTTREALISPGLAITLLPWAAVTEFPTSAKPVSALSCPAALKTDMRACSFV
jgi:hypothetical protein